MYVENKDGDIDGADARIGFVRCSKTGATVYFHGRELQKTGGQGIRGNFREAATGNEYWVSGVKKRGSNVHYAEPANVIVDDDALVEYRVHTNR